MSPPGSMYAADRGGSGFRHEVLLYAGNVDFVAQTVPFIQAGLEAEEPIFVVVDATKIERLHAELGRHADEVCFADMSAVGSNPARIIPAWIDFVNQHSGRRGRCRGIGEPIWAGRSPAELVESQRHEALLNLALAHEPALWLLCPYDTDSLASDVVEEAKRTHPLIVERGVQTDSSHYQGSEHFAAPFDAPLSDPPPASPELFFQVGSLAALRGFVSAYTSDLGLDADRRADMSLAVTEIATNTLLHGGGHGRFRIWTDADIIVCEVSDTGHIQDPLVGRRRPVVDQHGGRGMWIVNQLCDLVQVRVLKTGNVVRIHLSRF